MSPYIPTAYVCHATTVSHNMCGNELLDGGLHSASASPVINAEAMIGGTCG